MNLRWSVSQRRGWFSCADGQKATENNQRLSLNPLLSEALGAPGSPQRTRISCYAAPDRTACAAFFKESRMQFDNATNLDRKSGVPGRLRLPKATSALSWWEIRVRFNTSSYSRERNRS